VAASFVDNDLATVRKQPEARAQAVVVLYRGDEIEVVCQRDDWTEVRLGLGRTGWVRGLKLRATGLLEFAFIDVGQGDACLMTTPQRRKILIDGGENQLVARYLAKRFRGETVVFDAVVVTHGDADHFAGLSRLVEAGDEPRPEKRIRFETDRVFHNGLVKRPTALPEIERLGTPRKEGNRVLVPVVDDPRSVSEANRPFTRWQAALNELAIRRKLQIARLEAGSDAFSFLDVRVDVLGPRVVAARNGEPHLEMLRGDGGGGLSAARTINGHSVVLMVTHGNVRTLLTGDIHAAAERELLQEHAAGQLSLRADVLKVPHHGSDDVSRDFIRAVESLVSVISAGDDDARRDYLHPRANLLGLLGRADRGAEPVIFVTNLSGFDRWAGPAFHAVRHPSGWVPDTQRGTFYARERSVYGIVHVRTDGSRLLVVRRGARPERVEAYSFEIGHDGRARPLAVDRT